MNETQQAKFKSGPWALEDDENLGDVVIRAADGDFVALVPLDRNITRRNANAYLIAAAPEMYALLETEYMNWITEYGVANGPDHLTYACNQCDAAMALDDPWAINHEDDCGCKAIANLLAKANGPAVGHTDLF